MGHGTRRDSTHPTKVFVTLNPSIPLRINAVKGIGVVGGLLSPDPDIGIAEFILNPIEGLTMTGEGLFDSLPPLAKGSP
jgi:hypothetical protein